MGSEIARVERSAFDLVLPPDDAARADSLTQIWLRSFKSKNTRANYARDFAEWLAWCRECNVSPADARIAHTDMWIDRQREDGAAESSIARRVSAVSSWYQYAIANFAADDAPLIGHNPAKTKAKPTVDPDYSPTIGLTHTESSRLIDAADADSIHTAALIRTLLIGGLRVGTVIDAEIAQLGHDRGHRILDTVGKGGKLKRIAIPPFVGTAIDATLDARDNPEFGRLFVTPAGLPLTETYVFRLVRRLARRAGIESADRLSPHSLRHTAITELFEAGRSLRDVQDFAGHADPRTTRRYDRSRNNLDRHGSYTLASRFARDDDGCDR